MKKVFCFLLVMLCLTFSGCIEKNKMDLEQKRNYIIYNLPKYPKDLVMLKEKDDIRSKDLLIALFDSLVRIDEKGNVIPSIAESWTISDNNIEYLFNIRENANFSNGESIKAQDFVEFFKSILKDDNIYNRELFCIYGAENFSKGECDFENVAIKAIDDKKLSIRLNYPCSHFLQVLAQPVYSIRDIGKLGDWESNYKNINYSGAYSISNVLSGEEIILKKNPYYYGNFEVKEEEIHVTFIDNCEAALANFNEGKIDIFFNPPINEYEILETQNEIQYSPANNLFIISFNFNKKGLINNEKFREALYKGIDRSLINKEFCQNYIKTTMSYNTFLKEGDNSALVKDSEGVQKILKDVKYDSYNEDLKLIYEDEPSNRIITKNICESLKKNFKVYIESEGLTKEKMNETLKNGSYDMILEKFESSYSDYYCFLERWKSKNPYNIYGYSNYKFDEELFKLHTAKLKSEKIDKEISLKNMLEEKNVYIPVACFKEGLCKKDNIKGIYIDKIGNIRLEKLYIERK